MFSGCEVLCGWPDAVPRGPGGVSKFSVVTLYLIIFAAHGPKFIAPPGLPEARGAVFGHLWLSPQAAGRTRPPKSLPEPEMC